MTVVLTDPLEDQCKQILADVESQIRAERRMREEPPLIRLWDGDWNLQFVVQDEYEANFSLVDNDSGAGTLVLPFDSFAAQWVNDQKGRISRGEKRGVHITVDYCGIRWGGRLEDSAVEKLDTGDTQLVVTFLHDYENLKWYQVWSNPFLPAAVQFPRVWMVPGPARWALLTCLFVNILRDELSLWALPDDPLDISSWGSLDQSNWSVVVKPLSFMEDMAAGTVWAVPNSRWKTWHDMAIDILEDGEYSVVCRRYLQGDPAPWPGANLRHGTLVVSIEDKSGVYVGTSHGGTIFDGLVRTAVEFGDDLIDGTVEPVLGLDIPAGYNTPFNRFTDPTVPYVLYRDNEFTGIQTSKFTQVPAKGVQVNCGGHSMPGVNEMISAGIQAAGDIIGGNIVINGYGLGSIGGSIDTLLKPFYEDTILAWMSVKSLSRSSTAGWSRYFEYFQDGADKAYTLSSLMVLRTGFWATRNHTRHELVVADGAPYLIGENGKGHFSVGDRVGATIAGDNTGNVYMDRVSTLELAWSRDSAPEWKITIGKGDDVDPVAQAFKRIERLMTGMRDLGVF